MKDYREGYYSEAFNKFLNSAKLGNSQAQYNLGVMYENGEGVEVNIEKAKKWYSKALENGDNEARERFINGNLRLVLSVVQRFARKRREYG